MRQLLFLFATIMSASCFSQGFVTEVEQDDLSSLFGNDCIVTLASGEEVRGKLSSGTLSNGYLSAITIKKESGEKIKFKPEDVTRLSIKASKLVKLAMLSESTSSIKEMTKTNFDEIVKRDYVIFETAMRHNKSAKLKLMQLLNPGFDSGIKVFADPNAKETTGVGISGIKITGGTDKSYLFVQNDEKAVLVKKGKYKNSFDELYQNCPTMLQVFAGDKIKWEDIAGHVFVYDQVCK